MPPDVYQASGYLWDNVVKTKSVFVKLLPNSTSAPVSFCLLLIKSSVCLHMVINWLPDEYTQKYICDTKITGDTAGSAVIHSIIWQESFSKEPTITNM